jgi:hypothetical protein
LLPKPTTGVGSGRVAFVAHRTASVGTAFFFLPAVLGHPGEREGGYSKRADGGSLK